MSNWSVTWSVAVSYSCSCKCTMYVIFLSILTAIFQVDLG